MYSSIVSWIDEWLAGKMICLILGKVLHGWLDGRMDAWLVGWMAVWMDR